MSGLPPTGPGPGPALRGLSLFVNFFLIIFGYYLVKPASRSIYLDHFAADQLPYVWIGSALVLGLLMPFYSRVVEWLDRRQLVVATCLVASLLLAGFGLLFNAGATGPVEAIAFYILVDIVSVVLVEQFWSLTNASYASDSGSRWYGLVGSGGLAGGIVGGVSASWLLKHTPLQTYDLLFVGAGVIGLIGLAAALLARAQLYPEHQTAIRPPGLDQPLTFRRLLTNRYLMLIMATILLAQLVEPIVEYQFMSYVASSFDEREARTAFLSTFLSVLGGVALFINLLLTPLVLRYLGALAGMLMQPLSLAITAGLFTASPGLLTGAAMKVGDRGLSYSINRASKEMLYVPIEPVLIYRAKAWIDMFGYRLFKITGSLLVLALTQWFALQWTPAQFSLIVLPACLLWMAVVIGLRTDYGLLRRREATVQPLLAR
jgi:ATP:ADP antiporter, AAA family